MKEKAVIFIGFRHKTYGIDAARAAGFKVVLLTRKTVGNAAELFDEIIEENILDVEVLKRLIPYLKKKYAVKSIISNYEHYVVPRSFFAQRFGLPACSVYSACCSRNKAMQRYMLHFMEANIKHKQVKTLKGALRALKSLGGDVFLKSISGVKSRLIFHVTSEEEMKDAFVKLQESAKEALDGDLYDDYSYCEFDFHYPNPRTTFLVEKAAKGQQVTVSSLVGSHKVWHAPSVCDIYTASSIGRDDSFLAYRILPSKFGKKECDKVKDVTETAARILGLKHCSIFADLILTNDEDVKLVEIASRMGGYRPIMYEEAYGLNLNELLVKAALGKKIGVKGKRKNFISLVEIFPKERGVFKNVEAIEELKADENLKFFKQGIEFGEEVGKAQDGFGPVVVFMIAGKTYDEVKAKSDYYQEKLQVVVD